MSEFGEQIDAILAKGAKEWTNDETKIIGALIKAGQKANLQLAMLEVRGGEKPAQLVNNQKPVN